MLLPIKGVNPTKTFPYLTIIIIILNVYVFVLQNTLGAGEKEFFYFNHGVIPRCFVSMLDQEKYDAAKEETKDRLKQTIKENIALQRRMRIIYRSEAEQIDRLVEKNFKREIFGSKDPILVELLSLFASMFIHGSLWHLLGNVWFLWIFGNNIEDVLGRWKFILFYFVCGGLASFGHIFVRMGSILPTIGASGAISGVLGAYLLLYPHAKILTFIPIGWFLWLEELPAYIFLGYWIIIQLFFGFFIDPILSGGVAWFAHIAGFFAGVLFVVLFEKKNQRLFGSGRRWGPEGWE